jgi:hypothetical protein
MNDWCVSRLPVHFLRDVPPGRCHERTISLLSMNLFYLNHINSWITLMVALANHYSVLHIYIDTIEVDFGIQIEKIDVFGDELMISNGYKTIAYSKEGAG